MSHETGVFRRCVNCQRRWLISDIPQRHQYEWFCDQCLVDIFNKVPTNYFDLRDTYNFLGYGNGNLLYTTRRKTVKFRIIKNTNYKNYHKLEEGTVTTYLIEQFNEDEQRWRNAYGHIKGGKFVQFTQDYEEIKQLLDWLVEIEKERRKLAPTEVIEELEV